MKNQDKTKTLFAKKAKLYYFVGHTNKGFYASKMASIKISEWEVTGNPKILKKVFGKKMYRYSQYGFAQMWLCHAWKLAELNLAQRWDYLRQEFEKEKNYDG